MQRNRNKELLTQRIAKLIVEGAANDYSHAKQKAMHQLGFEHFSQIPSDQEIDVAISAYRAIFHPDALASSKHPVLEDALAVMKMFERFHPRLSVLGETAQTQPDIRLVLFSDDAKSVLLYLLKHQPDFVESDWKYLTKGRTELAPCYSIETKNGAEAHLVVLPENMQFSGNLLGGRLLNIDSVEAMLATPEST